jgi:phage/plasmid-like protein (TIGR03299 family)
MANIYVDRTTTWHAIGKSVQECKDMEAVLKASGLDYTVEKRPVFFEDENMVTLRNHAIPNRFVTVRTSDNHPYDVVSDKFEIIQNRDAFDFVNYMGEDLQFEKAGETQSGMVYIIGKLPEVDILGDKFTPHVIFRNGFNGKVKITAAISPLRLVCQNQFNFAFKNAANAITIRHVRNAEAKLQEARDTLKMCADYMSQLNLMAEHFATMKITGDRMERVVKYLFPIPEGVEINPFKRKNLEDQRAAFLKAHEQEDNRNFKGTAWGLINAYTDFITHKEPAGKRDDRFEGKFVNTTFKVSMNPIVSAIEATA